RSLSQRSILERSMRIQLFCVTCLCLLLSTSSRADDVDKQSKADVDSGKASLSATEIFDRRILPILRSSESSSCTECHFGGVELKKYLREDQATTFAALRDEGLIDVEQPCKSKILQFINRHSDHTDTLIAKVRQAEDQAFRTWI